MRKYAAVDIEKEITINKEDGTQVEEWLELGNGCKHTETSHFNLANHHHRSLLLSEVSFGGGRKVSGLPGLGLRVSLEHCFSEVKDGYERRAEFVPTELSF